MAIPVPTPPTDNLYKFLSISGLLIGVFCVTFMQIEVNKTKNLLLKTDAKIADLKYQERSLDLITLETGSTFTNIERAKLQKSLDEKLFEIRLQTAEAKARNTTNRKHLAPMMVTALLGFLISWFSFLLWYRKVQKPLDEILQLNLKKARLEAAALKENPQKK